MEISERRHTKEHLCFYFVQYSSSQNGLQLHISAEALHTWSDSTPLVSCRSISRLQSMLVAVKQSPRSTMSTFKTCNIFGSLLQAFLCTHSDWCKGRYKNKRFFGTSFPNVGGWGGWFPNKVQTPQNPTKSPRKSPFSTQILPFVFPNITKTLGWVCKQIWERPPKKAWLLP